jgi:predicted nucleic acid-binding protein
VKVFFDATVWCGAILKPAGVNARLLDLAARGGPLRDVTSDVVLLELYRHATGGTFNRVFEPEDVWTTSRRTSRCSRSSRRRSAGACQAEPTFTTSL